MDYLFLSCFLGIGIRLECW